MPWKGASFMAEMDRRLGELERSKEKGHTWEEVKQRARSPTQGFSVLCPIFARFPNADIID